MAEYRCSASGTDRWAGCEQQMPRPEGLRPRADWSGPRSVELPLQDLHHDAAQCGRVGPNDRIAVDEADVGDGTLADHPARPQKERFIEAVGLGETSVIGLPESARMLDMGERPLILDVCRPWGSAGAGAGGRTLTMTETSSSAPARNTFTRNDASAVSPASACLRLARTWSPSRPTPKSSRVAPSRRARWKSMPSVPRPLTCMAVKVAGAAQIEGPYLLESGGLAIHLDPRETNVAHEEEPSPRPFGGETRP